MQNGGCKIFYPFRGAYEECEPFRGTYQEIEQIRGKDWGTRKKEKE
jgi:hypothetical protein